MGTVVLDSSVVIGIFDPKDAQHRHVLAALEREHALGHRFVIPAVVLSEVLVGEARRNHGMVDERRALINRMFGSARTIDEEIAVAAAQLRAKHKTLRTPDALVIATGLVDEAEVILTGDKRWADIHESIQLLDGATA